VKCVVCRDHEAELPDRNSMGRPTKRVCRSCHRARLRGDMAYILEVEKKRREAERDDDLPDDGRICVIRLWC